MRRSVGQALHTIDDFDAAALERPHPTHGYVDRNGNGEAEPSSRIRHWKQRFWKRRNVQRHLRNQHLVPDDE